MDKTIITAFMVIVGVVCVVFVFNAVYPAVVESSQAMANMEGRVDERLKSQIQVLHAASSGGNVYVWVKNIGATSIHAVERCDLFFGPEGDFARIPYGAGVSYWEYEVENDTNWKPTATVKITIFPQAPLSAGQRYFIKVVLPNGVADDYYFSTN